MERQDPQGEENGDPAFAHVPRLVPGPQGQPILHPSRGGIQPSNVVGNHHSQLSSSSKDSGSSSFPAQKQTHELSMSESSTIPQSSHNAVSSASPQQGMSKAKDAHQMKLQQLQSQQQQLLLAAAAVASSTASSGPTSTLTSGKYRRQSTKTLLICNFILDSIFVHCDIIIR